MCRTMVGFRCRYGKSIELRLCVLKIDAESSLAAGTRTCRWLLTFKHDSLGHGSDNAIYTCIDYIYM